MKSNCVWELFTGREGLTSPLDRDMMGTKITVRVPVTADRASEVKLGAA